MDVQLLALDGLFDSGFTSFLDMMTEANALAPAGTKPFCFQTVGTNNTVTTRQGLRVNCNATLSEGHRPHVLVLPALAVRTGADLDALQQRPDVQEALIHIAQLHARASRK